jgi:hypothetical protein
MNDAVDKAVTDATHTTLVSKKLDERVEAFAQTARSWPQKSLWTSDYKYFLFEGVVFEY